MILPKMTKELYNFVISDNLTTIRKNDLNNGLIPIGRRNSFLASFAGSMRNKGFELEQIEKALLDANNSLLEKKLDTTEVLAIAKSISRYPISNSIGKENCSPSLSEAQKDIIFRGKLRSLYNKIIASSEAHELALHIQLLAFLGCSLGKLPSLTIQSTKHSSNLFVVVVGDTARARKGTSLNFIEAIFEQLDPVLVNSRTVRGISSGEGLISCVRDEEKKIERKTKNGKSFENEVIVHEGVKDKRLLLIDEEFASTLRILQREGNNLSQIIRSAWDGKNLEIKNKNSPIKSTKPHMCIIGHVTKNELRQSLVSTERTNGFANRYVWMWVKRERIVPFAKPFDMKLISDEISWLKDALSYGRSIQELRLPEDQDFYSEIYKSFELKDYPPDLEPLMARAEPIILRIASLYAILDRTSIINKDHLNAAFELWKYAEKSVEFIFSNQSTNITNESKIKNFIEARGGEVSKSDITRTLFNRNKKAAEIDRLIEGMVSKDLLSVNTRDSNGHQETIFSLIDEDIKYEP